MVRKPLSGFLGSLLSFDHQHGRVRSSSEAIKAVKWARFRERLAAPLAPAIRSRAEGEGPDLLTCRKSVRRAIVANHYANQATVAVPVAPSLREDIAVRRETVESRTVQGRRIRRNRHD